MLQKETCQKQIARLQAESKKRMDPRRIRRLASDPKGVLILDPANPRDREWLSRKEDGIV